MGLDITQKWLRFPVNASYLGQLSDLANQVATLARPGRQGGDCGARHEMNLWVEIQRVL